MLLHTLLQLFLLISTNLEVALSQIPNSLQLAIIDVEKSLVSSQPLNVMLLGVEPYLLQSRVHIGVSMEDPNIIKIFPDTAQC